MRRPAAAALAAMVAAAVGVLAAACGGSDAPSAPVPASTEALVRDGRGLYAAYCASCHGGDMKGTKQGPPLLDAIYRPGHHADAAFVIAVRAGVRPHHFNFGPMPPIPEVSSEQVRAIVAFVRAEQQAVGIR